MDWLDLEARDQYFALISEGSEPKVRVNGDGVCYKYESLIGGHVHHITPRSEGGNNDPANLVDLSYQDHLKAHYLLSKGIKTNEARQAYRCMITFQGDWGEEPELTDEMAEEYAIACEAHKEFMSKPVAIFKGYLRPKSYRLFSSHTECREFMDTSISILGYWLERSAKELDEAGKPRPIQQGPLKGYIFVDPDCEWVKDYLRLGHAPHINSKLFNKWRAA